MKTVKIVAMVLILVSLLFSAMFDVCWVVGYSHNMETDEPDGCGVKQVFGSESYWTKYENVFFVPGTDWVVVYTGI